MKKSASLFIAGKLNQIVNKRASGLDKMTKEIDSIHGKISVLARSKCTVKGKVYDVIDAQIDRHDLELKQAKESQDSDSDSLSMEERSNQLRLKLNEASPAPKM